MNVAYEYVDVDAVEGADREKVLDELKSFNPRCSFPSLVVNNNCIVGYQEDKIKEALQRP
jgi:glutaredoxin